MNADPVVTEDYHVGSDRDFLHRSCVSLNVKPIHAGILRLVKVEIPDLHEISFPGQGGRIKPSPMELPWGRMPRCFRLLRYRHLTAYDTAGLCEP